jgi:hypothetical protein
VGVGGGGRSGDERRGLDFDLYDSFWWFGRALHAYAMFGYGAVLTGAHNQRLLLFLTLGSLRLGVLW